MAFDGKAFGAEVVGVVKDFVAREVTPLLARLEALERRIDNLPAPLPDKDADLGEVRQIIADELAAVKSELIIPEIEIPPLPELPDIPAMVKETVDAAFRAIPETWFEVTREIVRENVEAAFATIPLPQDGKSVTVDDVMPAIERQVADYLAAMPLPQDGKSVTVDDVMPLIVSEVEKSVSALPPAKKGEDGVGLAGAIIDRDGNLVVTLTNGEAKSLGPVVGADGAPGNPGENGVDGFGFDDLDASYDGAKTVTLKFTKGERVKEFAFTMPVVIDRGVYKEGQTYTVGDSVTWGGSLWIAQEDTDAKPDTGKSWRLAVKRGRDGKDGVVKEERAPQPVRVGVPA